MKLKTLIAFLTIVFSILYCDNLYGKYKAVGRAQYLREKMERDARMQEMQTEREIRERELQLRERELQLRERELQLRERKSTPDRVKRISEKEKKKQSPGKNFRANPDRTGTPSYTVKSFFRAMASGDFATAKNYVVAKEIQGMITNLEMRVQESSELGADVKKDFSHIFDSLKFKSAKIKGKNAEVTISVVNSETGKREEKTFKLKKINGIWKIAE